MKGPTSSFGVSFQLSSRCYPLIFLSRPLCQGGEDGKKGSVPWTISLGVDKFLLSVCSLNEGRSHQKGVKDALTSWPHSSSFWKELRMGSQTKRKKAI